MRCSDVSLSRYKPQMGGPRRRGRDKKRGLWGRQATGSTSPPTVTESKALVAPSQGLQVWDRCEEEPALKAGSRARVTQHAVTGRPTRRACPQGAASRRLYIFCV